MLYATFRRGSHDETTRVHRIPSVTGEPGYSDYRPALCGATAAHRLWAPVETLPPADATPPRAYLCPRCFPEGAS
jgi:hypothetical protein